jgi:hypothetical protein
MKKFLSISFSFLILLSVMHITVATHHCDGSDATFEKLSVTGKLASCGMENTKVTSSESGKYFSTHCCDDNVVVLAVDNNYSPSSYDFKVFPQSVLQIFDITASVGVQSFSVSNLLNTNFRPPGCYQVSAVSLPGICVFRI